MIEKLSHSSGLMSLADAISIVIVNENERKLNSV
jgi:hypothetical protein